MIFSHRVCGFYGTEINNGITTFWNGESSASIPQKPIRGSQSAGSPHSDSSGARISQQQKEHTQVAMAPVLVPPSPWGGRWFVLTVPGPGGLSHVSPYTALATPQEEVNHTHSPSSPTLPPGVAQQRPPLVTKQV